MQQRKRMSGLIVASMLTAAIAAPAAVAKPIDPHGAGPVQSSRVTDAQQTDMHASTVHKPAAPKQDLRSEAAADTSRAPKVPAGLPTWPVNPQPIAPAVEQPVADVSGDGNGIDVDWPIAALALAGSLLIGGSLGVAGTRYRTTHTRTAG